MSRDGFHMPTLMTCDGKHDTRAIAYTDHRGEKRIRVIRPLRLWWGMFSWKDTEPQWLIDVWDFEEGATRTYALSMIDGSAGIELLPEAQSVGAWGTSGSPSQQG
jgi:hypothetical protein